MTAAPVALPSLGHGYLPLVMCLRCFIASCAPAIPVHIALPTLCSPVALAILLHYLGISLQRGYSSFANVTNCEAGMPAFKRDQAADYGTEWATFNSKFNAPLGDRLHATLGQTEAASLKSRVGELTDRVINPHSTSHSLMM